MRGSLEDKKLDMYIMNSTNEYNYFNFSHIESFYKPPDIEAQLEKCFTYFSSLEKATRQLNYHVNDLHIHLKMTQDWFPLNLFNHIRFAIHSPNSLPDENNLVELNPHAAFTIEFNQITTELLGNNYDTDCFEYDLDYKFANYNMRSDCMTSCVQNTIKIECNLNGLMLFGGIFRNDLLKQQSNRLLHFNNDKADCQENIYKIASSNCRISCRQDCKFIYYPTIYEKKNVQNYGVVHLDVIHNQLPDIHIKYLPQTTLLSLVCDFGGVLGMWLGLSFYNALNFIFLILKRNIEKITFVNEPRVMINIHNDL